MDAIAALGAGADSLEAILTFLSREAIAVGYFIAAGASFREAAKSRSGIWRPQLIFWGSLSVAWGLFISVLAFSGGRVPSDILSALSRGLHIPVVIALFMFIRTRRRIRLEVEQFK